ncbi:MAG: hypothetical protein OEZ03_16580 [Alphaproteobacteria bacterium]|nr:hypothetical protein [Alphaproteobacteria bacterium]
MTENTNLEKPPLTPLRWFFAIAGGMIMLFAGGCGLFYTGIGVYIGLVEGDHYASVFIMLGLAFGGIPALIGWLVWWAAVKRGRKSGVLEENGAAGVN